MIESSGQQLIVCAAHEVDSISREILETYPLQKTIRFLMHEWLTDRQLQRADLLWILDASPHWSAVLPAMSAGIPILAAEWNTEMKTLCEDAGCGLYYTTGPEARDCLAMLLKDHALRRRLGDNAQSYATAHPRRALRAMTA
jgi:glycosyltransferase involved in cell wall biosynthesis